VGSKIDTDVGLLGNMIPALLESRGMAAESKLRTRSCKTSVKRYGIAIRRRRGYQLYSLSCRRQR